MRLFCITIRISSISFLPSCRTPHGGLFLGLRWQSAAATPLSTLPAHPVMGMGDVAHSDRKTPIRKRRGGRSSLRAALHTTASSLARITSRTTSQSFAQEILASSAASRHEPIFAEVVAGASSGTNSFAPKDCSNEHRRPACGIFARADKRRRRRMNRNEINFHFTLGAPNLRNG